jgi:hypothetical protein
MRAALPLKATNARAERAEERARANALRAQIDELNAELVVVRAEADRALAEERQRVDRLNEQVEALSAEVVRAEKQAEAVVGRAERAEAGRDAERVRAEALRTSIDELKARQALMIDMHARELAVARHDALAAQQAAAELRQAERAPSGGRGGAGRGSGRRGGGSRAPLLGDLFADGGCSERPRVSSEMPVPEPLAPDGMGSGVGLRRCFRHRRAQTTPPGKREVEFPLSPAPPML